MSPLVLIHQEINISKCVSRNHRRRLFKLLIIFPNELLCYFSATSINNNGMCLCNKSADNFNLLNCGTSSHYSSDGFPNPVQSADFAIIAFCYSFTEESLSQSHTQDSSHPQESLAVAKICKPFNRRTEDGALHLELKSRKALQRRQQPCKVCKGLQNSPVEGRGLFKCKVSTNTAAKDFMFLGS